MWQVDTVTLQTGVETNTNGSISTAWTDGDDVLCDVQEINKEYAYKRYGFEESTEYRQVFDHTNATWVKGEQVKYDSEQWLIRKVDANMAKMGASNHTFIIISKVI